MRPTWDSYFMKMAHEIKNRSTCLRRQVGAVAVKDNRILTTGYNGAPSRCKHCLDIGCKREELGIPSGERQELCMAVHAEQNVVAQAASHGISLAGSSIYVTLFPCITCTKILINSGIRSVMYDEDYSDAQSLSFFHQSGVKILKYDPNNTY